MVVEAMGSVEVFFSYDQEDEPLQKRLEQQLHFLKRQGLISAWHNRTLLAGQEVDSETKRHLATAHLILLLISPDFLSSDYCCKVEVTEAMRRHVSGDAHVIPIILRHVYWQDEPFSRLQVLPAGGKPVQSWSDIDEAFRDIAYNIQRVVKRLLLNRCFNLIEKLCQENRHEEAFNICEQAYRLTINNADQASMRLFRGNILLNEKKYEEALAAYEEAAQHDPSITDMDFFRNKGQALQYLERFREALTAYEEAECLGSRDPNLYHNKGIVLERLAQQAHNTAYELDILRTSK